MKTILLLFTVALSVSSYASQTILGPVSPKHAYANNAGIIIFQDLSESINQVVSITSASLTYFGGTKSGHFCSNPLDATHPLRGTYSFTLTNHLFAYQLHPIPVYKSFQPDDPSIPITDVHCLEFIIQSGDHTFSPQLVSFNVDCSQNHQCVATSPAEIVVVSQ
ncbi:MAG: hypothetical protein P1U63_04845 [Coxiellaceae bacterium]|nr:hypothetical protein [Coxiellaceae bacterium]